jgi:hypothetical protein
MMRRDLTEAARDALAHSVAISAVQMELDTYKSPGPHYHRCYDENGALTYNVSELLRLCGYGESMTDHMRTRHRLLSNPQFLKWYEYEKEKCSNPLFREDATQERLAAVLHELTCQISYRVLFGKELSFTEQLRLGEFLLKLRGANPPQPQGQCTQDILSSLSPERRQRLLREAENFHKERAEEMAHLQRAHQAADSLAAPPLEDDS